MATLSESNHFVMRILRGLSSKTLPCGCVAGVYETYDGQIVGILDGKAAGCSHSEHRDGNIIPSEIAASPQRHAGQPSSKD